MSGDVLDRVLAAEADARAMQEAIVATMNNGRLFRWQREALGAAALRG